MSFAISLEQLKDLERPIEESDRQKLLDELRSIPTLDGASRVTALKSKTDGYMHAAQDTEYILVYLLSESMGVDSQNKTSDKLNRTQACFVQDLENYQALLPANYQPLHDFTTTALRVGTSTRWGQPSRQWVTSFAHTFRAVDKEIFPRYQREIAGMAYEFLDPRHTALEGGLTS